MYSNVLFHDNYWQDQSSPIYGKAVPGAYIRKLTSFNGGYSGTGSEHSDVHLWYHGTVDWRIPASDTEATIPATERSIGGSRLKHAARTLAFFTVYWAAEIGLALCNHWAWAPG